jgi:hypothetical protein
MASEIDISGVTLIDRGQLGFDLEGDPDSLRALADSLATGEALRVSAKGGQGLISIVRADGLTVMAHRSSHATFTGRQEHLDLLAETLRYVADGPSIPSPVQFHTHVEWYDGHPWLDPHTEPVVIHLKC